MVNIDQPLLPRESSKIVQALLGFLVSDVVKAAAAAFIVAMLITVLARSGDSVVTGLSGVVNIFGSFFGGILAFFQGILNGIAKFFKGITQGMTKFTKGFALRLADLKPSRDGVPMTFDDKDNDGWGVCTLRSKKRLGRTNFVQYDFDLPKPNQVLPLKLGQQAALCCLDNTGSVSKGDFYVYHPQTNPMLGRFAIVAPNKGGSDNEYDVGSDAANFVSLLLGMYAYELDRWFYNRLTHHHPHSTCNHRSAF